MGTNSKNTMYRVPIWDVSMPAFVSGSAYVYGTEDDLAKFISVRSKVLGERAKLFQEVDGESSDYLLDAYGTWRESGEIPEVNVAYQNHLLLEEVSILHGPVRFEEGAHEETYENIYSFPYEIRADGVSWEVVIIRQDDRSCLRLVKVDVTGMAIEAHLFKTAQWMPVTSSWGEFGIIDIHGEGGDLSTTMFLAESTYDSEEEAMATLDGTPRLSLAPVMDQIVADG